MIALCLFSIWKMDKITLPSLQDTQKYSIKENYIFNSSSQLIVIELGRGMCSQTKLWNKI